MNMILNPYCMNKTISNSINSYMKKLELAYINAMLYYIETQKISQIVLIYWLPFNMNL